MKVGKIMNELFQRYPQLNICKEDVFNACIQIEACYRQGGKLLVCGNGGSCSDSDHIVGELMKSFEFDRPLSDELKTKLGNVCEERGTALAQKLESGLPTISLNAHQALFTAVLNDIGADYVFAQQVVGYGIKGDMLIVISSSGNSQNVIDAAIVAKAKGLKVIGLSGERGGGLKKYCDVIICVPSSNTRIIQELHLPIYHFICKTIEQSIFNPAN